MLFKSLLRKSVSQVRKVVVFVVGGTVLLIGVAMVVLPGPAIVVIPVGLGILSIEFAWAGLLLKRAKRYFNRALESVGSGRTSSAKPEGEVTRSSKGSKHE